MLRILHNRGSLLLISILTLVTFCLCCQAELSPDVKREIQSVLPKLDKSDPPGKMLFSDNFSLGLAKWTTDSGWIVESTMQDSSPYAKGVASTGYVNLITKDRISVNPRHAIAVSFKTKRLSGTNPVFLRVDAFDEKGKNLCANQYTYADAGQWTAHNVLLNDWIPDEAASITLQFFLDPNAETTTGVMAVRLLDLTPDMETRNTEKLVQYSKKLNGAKKLLNNLPKNTKTAQWRKDLTPIIAKGLSAVSEAKKTNILSAAYPKAVDTAGMWANRVTDILAGLKDGTIATSRFVVYSTNPISGKMALPNAGELDGVKLGKAEMAACAGEYESASLVLWSPAVVKNVLPVATDFKGSAGTIPASNVDIKWVKTWFQAGGAPRSVAVSNGKALVNELLLNDDSMVKVDLKAKSQLLKLHFPGGDKYVPIDGQEKPNPEWGIETPGDKYPVKDSSVLLPSNIPSCENKQVWITVQVPENAKPGNYVGKIQFMSGKQNLGSISISLKVLPFSLPEPKTRYDLSKPYTGSLYYWGILSKKPEASIGYKIKNEAQFRAELKSMYTHNIVAPAMIWGPDLVYKDETHFRKSLSIMKEFGMNKHPLYIADSGLIGNTTDPESLAALKENVTNAIKIAREYGFDGIYFYGIDEAVGEVLKSERVAWGVVHDAGGKVWVSGWGNIYDLMGDILDQLNWAGDTVSARVPLWHKNGHTVWNYANPQTPIEDPEVYRRNYGLYNWKLDVDGTCTYCYMDSSGLQWNDWDGASYRDHCLAYPTVDGVVGTLALEGLREALDDVKYATRLMICIDENQNGAKSVKAAEAKKWLENIDTSGANLHTVRTEMIKRILDLSK